MTNKSLTNFPLLLFSLLVVSCSTDSSSEDMEEEQISPLVGNYELTELIANEPSTFNDGTNIPYNMVEELDCLNPSLELKADMSAESVGRNILFEMDMDGNFVYSCAPDVNSNTLTWQDNGDTVEIGRQTFQVIGNRLVLEDDPNDPIVLYYRVVWMKR